MCCLFAALMIFGPRFGILVWWLMDPERWESAFSSFFPSLLGFLFLPWTTLMYVVVAPNGVAGFDWIILAWGLFVDIAGYSSSAYSRQQRYGSQPV